MKTSVYDFDLFVVGGGSGGVRAARYAAKSGARVGLAESGQLGGTCVNRGCVPKKLYVYSSHYSEDFADSKGYGWESTKPQFSWHVLQKNKDKEIGRLNQVYAKLLEEAGVKVFYAHASLVDRHSLELQDAAGLGCKRVTAERILIASGSTPFVPFLPGREYVCNSDDIFMQKELPKKIAVLGGGYIAVEFAGIFSSLGCQTTLLYRGDLFLRGFDESIRCFFQEEMQKKGVDLRFKKQVEKIQKEKDGSLCLFLNDGKKLGVDQAVSAMGRVSNTKGMKLEDAGITLDSSGNIPVDSQFCTNADSIYALGDVIGRVRLTPVAIAEAVYFVRTVFQKEKLPPFNYKCIPTAVFSQPSIGTVGLSEEEAKKEHKDVHVYESSFKELKHTLSGRQERTLIKLIVEGKDGRVLGAHIVGAESGEIIQGLAIALKAGAEKKDFDNTIGVHPTRSEEFVSL